MAIPSFAAIITAAGKSERFSQGTVKKEYLTINGRTVIQQAVAPFLAVPSLRLVVVTCPEGGQEECAVALGDLFERQSVPTMLCEGGATRQESVRKALGMIRSIGMPVGYVAIHDGARPFVTTDLIIRTLATATVFGGAAPALPSTDAMKTIDEQGMITGHLERRHTISVQTPQIFRFPDILEAHEQAARTGKAYIDDTEIFTDSGRRVGVCQGDRANRKITYLEEIPDAETQIARYRSERERGMQAKQAHEELEQAILETKERRKP